MSTDVKESKEILREHGIILLSGEIDESVAERICQDIIGFNLRDDVSQIHLIINSPGGACPAGFAIINMMEWSRLPVYTSGTGMVASMGLMVFMAGAKGRRVITTKTSILSHRYSSMSKGNHSQLLASRKEQDLEHERIVEHYLNYSNVTSRKELERYLLCDVDTWLSPEEAIRFGLADIVEPMRLLEMGSLPQPTPETVPPVREEENLLSTHA
jgi:ATP-dependent Clp protease protease subunit